MSDKWVLFSGRQEQATYLPSEEPIYQHNPFIEALPTILTSNQIVEKISRNPVYNKVERLKSVEFRLHAVQRISSYLEVLPQHLELERRFSRMIRDGYKARNPIGKEWVKQIRAGFKHIHIDETIDYTFIPHSTSGFALIGTSGIGKTTAINSVLSLYPQVIFHHEYNGTIFERVQLVWVKLDCPYDGGLRGLCLNFFKIVDQLIGTRYSEKYQRRTIDELIPLMSELAAVSGLGVLVIDEIQRLDAAKSGGAERMENFFVQLSDNIGVPVLQIGTFKALHFLSDCLAIGRRNSGQGSDFWTNFAKGDDWEYFLEGLWKYQWTLVENPLTPELISVMYEESQGITDIAKKLYMLTQWQVIGSSDETITPNLIRRVAKDNLQLVRPMLNALKEKDYQALRQFKDIYISDEELQCAFQNSRSKINLVGELNNIRNQRQVVYASGEQDELLKELTTWLMDSGIDIKVALICADQAMKRHAMEHDLNLVRKEAFRLALQKGDGNEEQIEKQEGNKEKQSKKISSLHQRDLRVITSSGQKKKLNFVDSLRESGYIKNPLEFLN